MLTSLMPIGDDNVGRTITPYLTYLLIAVNIFVFVFLQLPNEAFTYSFAVIPREIVQNQDLVGLVQLGPETAIRLGPGPKPVQLTILTAMFMHGGWAHLLGNMLYLWIFGDNVEDAMGHGRYLLFYLLCGLIATFAHILSEPQSLIPSLGASGAIAGVLGAYLVLYPTRRVKVLMGYVGIVEMPAVIVIGFWLVLQLISGFGSIAVTDESSGGVAYWAHIGGAIAGLILVGLFRKKRTRTQRVRH